MVYFGEKNIDDKLSGGTHVKIRLILGLLLLLLAISGNCHVYASPEWNSRVTTDNVEYYVDKNTIAFSGEESDKVVDFWIKAVDKNKQDSYTVCHLLVRKATPVYIEAKNTVYSLSGDVITSSDSIMKGWQNINPDSYIGIISKQLFAQYQANPNAYIPQYISPVNSDSQQLNTALANSHINHDTTTDGINRYFVRDTCTKAGFHTAMDFWLLKDNNNNKIYRLNLSTISSFLSPSLSKVAVVTVDGENWLLAAPLPKGNTDFPGFTKCQVSLDVPPSLFQAIISAKDSVVITWYYGQGGIFYDWGKVKEWKYQLSKDVVQNLQLMYEGF